MNRKILTGIIAFAFLIAISGANAALTINSPLNTTYVQYDNPIYDMKFSVYSSVDAKDCFVTTSSPNTYLLVNSSLKDWNITRSLWSGDYLATFNCTNATGTNTYASVASFTIEAHSTNILGLLLASFVVVTLIAGLLFVENERLKHGQINIPQASIEILMGIIMSCLIGIVISTGL